MIYPLTLGTAFLLAGFLLLLLGILPLVLPEATERWLIAFPRSRMWGFGLLGVATLWAWVLIKTIDLGEFAKWQHLILIVIPVAALLTAQFVDELLAARALGMVLLLAAEPLLEAAFLQPEVSRLALVIFAYVGIVAGMFWIGMPYLLRDQVRWLTTSPVRLRTGAVLVAAYGALLLIFGLTLHRSA